MSSLFDVTGIAVDEGQFVALIDGIQQVTVQVDQPVSTVTITADSGPEVLQIEVPGPQGPPGLQNVYIQTNDPSIEYSWGMDEKDFIWIQTT